MIGRFFFKGINGCMALQAMLVYAAPLGLGQGGDLSPNGAT
ncbi:hypothetical protein ADICEAN_01734 [Cesiribacter andamanensis AMV16]|uniref:Uncharacterized protein n=1 Tax=Cesiribacter andamanensis AMV16 TaxID=1279009 RepID=M7N370_9BACT|nr:hypothetical protein ADICEAN_01734 [Cesiribacter andamanensis AMV16]